MTGQLPILDQLRAAADNRERAQLLLQCPDEIVLRHEPALRQLCERAGFSAGADFVVLRAAAQLAVRDPDGALPMRLARPLEDYRRALALYAAGQLATID